MEQDGAGKKGPDQSKGTNLLAIGDGGAGLEDGADQGLKPAPPAPRSGTEALGHHGTVLVEECAESLAGDQGRCLRAGEAEWQKEKDKFLEISVCDETRIHVKTDGAVLEVGSFKSKGRVVVWNSVVKKHNPKIKPPFRCNV